MDVLMTQNNSGLTESYAFKNNRTEANSSEVNIPSPPDYIVISSTILYTIIFLVGIVGNILVVVVISCSRRMKTTVNMYLLNLCIADTLVIMVCMPTALADIFTKEVWLFGEFMCMLVPFLENAVAHASVLTITAITFERYKVVRYPLKSVDDNMRAVKWILLGIWFASAASCVPYLFITKFMNATLYDGTPVKVCRVPIVGSWSKAYIISLIIVFFVLPALLLFALNCHIYHILHITCRQDIEKHDSIKRHRQVGNNIASIVGIFFLCHLPFRVVSLWLVFATLETIKRLGLERYLLLIYSARICFYINHAINPVIYNFVSSKFRGAFRDLTTRCRLFGFGKPFLNVTPIHRGSSRITFRSYTSARRGTSNL